MQLILTNPHPSEKLLSKEPSLFLEATIWAQMKTHHLLLLTLLHLLS